MQKTRKLELEALKLCVELQDWIRDRDGVSLFIKLNEEDRLRLLRLRTWEMVYHVPVREILDIIVAPIRAHSDLRGRKRYGLGTSIASLTGYHAEQILTTIIGRKYPTNEHVGFWREQERDRQLRVEKVDALEGMQPRDEVHGSLLEASSVDSFVRTYTKSILAKRKADRIEGDARWRRRKKYRGNPWI